MQLLCPVRLHAVQGYQFLELFIFLWLSPRIMSVPYYSFSSEANKLRRRNDCDHNDATYLIRGQVLHLRLPCPGQLQWTVLQTRAGLCV